MTERPRRRLAVLVEAFRFVVAVAPRRFAAVAVLDLVTGAGVAVQLLVARRLLAQVSGGVDTFGDVTGHLVALALVAVALAVADVLIAEWPRAIAERVDAAVLEEVVATATAADLADFDDPAFHDHLRRVEIHAVSRPWHLAWAVVHLGAASCATAGVAVALVVIEPFLLLLSLVALVPLSVATVRSSRLLFEHTVRTTALNRERRYLTELLTGRDEAKEIRVFGADRPLRERWAELTAERVAAVEGFVRRRIGITVAGRVAATVLGVGVVAVVVASAVDGRLSLADAAIAAVAAQQLHTRLSVARAGAANLIEAGAFVGDFLELRSRRPARRTPASDGAALPWPADIELRDVSFTYTGMTQPAVRDISMRIPAGHVVALVGRNGSGKTTLAKLLTGLYRPSAGTVLWGDVDLESVGRDSRRRSMSAIFQDFVRYELPMRWNIAIGRPELVHDDDAIRRACRAAGADTVVATLPDGLDTRLGRLFDGGADLSQGQWQLVALARAVFQDTPFVVLDEPTASVDAHAEAELFRRMREHMAGRSVLLVSHRLASVRTADHIYVLEGGRIIESGTHDDLLALDGRYAAMFRLQAAAYAEAEEASDGI